MGWLQKENKFLVLNVMAMAQREKHVHNARVEETPPNKQLQDVLSVMEQVVRRFETNAVPVMAVARCSKSNKKTNIGVFATS